MRHARFIVLLAFHVFVGAAYSQKTGTVRLLVDPGHDFEFVVDHKFRMQQREVKLTEGLHSFSLWAPTRVVVDTGFFVIADRTSDLVVHLPMSTEFVQYRKELGAFQTKKRWTRAAPILAMTGGLIWTAVAYDKYNKAAQVLDEDQALYDINVDPANIRTLKGATIPADKEAFKDARNNLYMASAFTVLTGAATWYFFNRTAGWEVPVFEDKEKILFEGLSWSPGKGQGVFMAGLTIHLDR
ncbi:MAG: hypothetical protein KDC00_07065 [Flavobacteriales bacterium]|nr:hypothetical protein [Flavobacteriales bacterium]